MREIPKDLINGDQALEPIYLLSKPNMNIPLWEGEFEYYTPNIFRAKGKAITRLLPSPSTRIEFESNSRYGLYPNIELSEEYRLQIDSSIAGKGRVMLDLASPFSNEKGRGIHCEGELTRDIITEQIECNKVSFHLPNFLSYLSENIHSISSGSLDHYTVYNRSGRQRLNDGTWEIILDCVFNYRDIEKQLGVQGGFGITHIGMLYRIDGSIFKASQAENILNALYWFLSFARGFRCGPMLFVGSLNDKIVWEPWNVPALHPWKKGIFGWIDKRSIKTMTAMDLAYKGFMLKWADDYWRPCLRQAIHWYTEANRGAGGMEGVIALEQLALELICWACLEEQSPDKATVKAFNRKDASEKIRDTLKILNIPSDIDNISIVKDYLDKNIIDGTIKDGPRAISYLRNAIVHPKKEKRAKADDVSDEVKYAIGKIAQNYIALAILKIIGYNGSYLSHISWDEEQVPWVTSIP